jgi:hypothetical protein
MQWENGTIDAYLLPGGNFISSDLQLKRLKALRENTAYREAIEKAQRVAGYTDKLLLISRGGIKSEKAIESLIKQNKKAEKLIRQKGLEDEEAKSNIVCSE